MDTLISIDVKQEFYKENLGDSLALPNRQVKPKHSTPMFSKLDKN